MNGDLSRKSQIFSTPVYLTPSLMKFPWELRIGAHAVKYTMMGLPRADK